MSDEIIQAQNKQITASDIAARVAPYRWKRGESGNPGGRPKRKPLTEELERILAETGEDNKTYARKLIKAAVDRAIKRSDFALAQVWDRIEGKVPSSVTGANGGPVQFQVAVLYRSVEDNDD
jgi:Family of unknown function (DUF5681)